VVAHALDAHRVLGPERRARSGGFTLIELMIVIAIIAIIAAIAIPNLQAARKGANETRVIGACRQIFAAQQIFKDRDKDGNNRFDYALSLDALGAAGLIDPELAEGEKYGYRFEFVSPTTRFRFSMRATCLALGRAGDNGYWVDETGVIRICNGNFADTTDPPIGGK
jgi:prepilin-type N-terminal cleavage/methylation domain-containing protein